MIERYGFAEVLSLEEMINDLQRWASPEWTARLAELRAWITGFLDAIGPS